jgi:PAS domain S-box-containing protein
MWSIRIEPDGSVSREHLSPEFLELTGYPIGFFGLEGSSEVIEDAWFGLVVPEDQELLSTTYTEMLAGKRVHKVFEYRIRRADGEVIWVRDNTVCAENASGGHQWDGILTDISAKKHAEAAEAETREELAQILGAVGDCLWNMRIDPDGSVTRQHMSPEFLALTGYPMSFFELKDYVDPSNEPWVGLIVPEDREAVSAIYAELTTGALVRRVCEYRIIRADGETIWIRDNTVTKILPSGEIHYDGVMSDITAIKRAEEERRELDERIGQTQKLESIGVLAGGIAHDFNNLLVVVMGNADIAASASDCPSHIRESLMDIERAAQRASELCRELMVYSGRAPYVTAPIELPELISEMEQLLQLANAPGIEIQNNFQKDLARIEGDATQIRQLVMNLITNAVDAMSGSQGVIRISLKERRCEIADLASTFTHESLPAGQYVVLSVSDTGCGMKEETLTRIFDPFFTTKFTGRGLGLAAVLGIVRAHLGAISVKSELGVGTTSLIYLPALAKQHEALAPEVGEVEKWLASGLVLYVDDEDLVRRVGVLMLERMGMKVISVASGEEALKVIESGAHEFRCVILDLMMPGLSGTDTLRAIREKDSKLPVLIVTGYGESDASDLIGGVMANGLLAKPFQGKQLERALRSILEEPA